MITLQGITMQYATRRGVVQALRGIDLEVKRGEFFVLLGPSGSGKTSLLRSVAGLEKPDSGSILLGEKTVFSGRERIFVSPADRKVGMVFQYYAIWPHMTVFENVALPLTHGKRRLPKPAVRDRVSEALKLVQLEGFAERPAPLLSGGQQQRVALARALAIKPHILLMDEPLSNLDARLREEVRSEIRGLVKAIGVTVLYVTHDQEEAMALADRIAVMDKGLVLQVGRPQALYHEPVDPTVAEFLGRMNWLEGRITEKAGTLQTEIGTLYAEAAGGAGSSASIAIRPEDIRLSVDPSGRFNEFEGEILGSTFLGDYTLYHLRILGKKIMAKAVGNAGFRGRVYFWIPAEKIHVFSEVKEPCVTVKEAASLFKQESDLRV